MTSTRNQPNEEALRAFSKQAAHFDADDAVNPILAKWRKQIYQHVEEFLEPPSRILEINAGTGIDAVHFASRGHAVHATDAAEGMIEQIQNKIKGKDLGDRLTSQHIAFDHLSEVSGSFDYVFSNFGGLNCLEDLHVVAASISKILKPGGFITWVIMPPLSPWEWQWAFKGKFKAAFRRLSHGGTMAHLEGHFFKTYYHSLAGTQKALGPGFKLLRAECLGLFSPPPASYVFENRFPRLSGNLRSIENKLKRLFPFNRMGDHIILTFKKMH